MNIDNFISKGTSHFLCEDYSLIGGDVIPYAIIADGCSSSDMSDVGSRILSFAAKKAIQHDYNKMDLAVMAEADRVASTMGIPMSALDSTLCVATAWEKTNTVNIQMFGDGFIFYRLKSDNVLVVKEISYAENAPYYLTVQFGDFQKKRRWNEAFPENNKVTSITRIKDGIPEGTLDLAAPCEEPTNMNLPIDDLDFVAVASDGMDSFIDKMGNKKDVLEVATQAFAYKNVKGSFVKRRMGAMLKKLSKEGFEPYDDISIAVMQFPSNLEK